MQRTLTIFQLSQLQRQIALAPTIPVAPQSSFVYGYVFNYQLRPAAKMTVFLVNGQRAWVPAYGVAVTDNRGFFSIGYSRTVSSGGGSAPTPPNAYLYLQAADQGNVLYLGYDPIICEPGVPQFRRITLPPPGLVS